MWAIEGYLHAKPGVRLLWVTPYQNSDCDIYCPTIVAAIRAVCDHYGVPVLDLYHQSGVSPATFSFYLYGDHVHPNAAGSVMLGRRITNFINQQY